ncbi:FecR family protein [Chitinophaga qingshengii]|uniref:FecR domain-containing protein n=1 Tax=Chitinophaga qingshengii TaxID=1569794 RepID=A0ABR7TPF8_9BACT|nr:FecR family protein [Chitinophaga qingshengii]MBC9932357.1 FecR domain-containing protein [Chitinophaga qingshengii]
MPDTERLIYLLSQARRRLATSEEYTELLDMIRADDTGVINAEIAAFHGPAAPDNTTDPAEWQLLATAILAADKTPPHRIRSFRWRWAAAACLLLLAGTTWWWLRPTHAPAPAVAQLTTPDVAPGGNKAILTLSDGSQITLDSASNGILAQQGNSKVSKLANGQVVYDASGASQGKILYNTMSTPLGGQYKLTLPDGSHVWLNAGSSITYPTAFTGNERKVTVTGEAYFEVARNAAMPFRVIANQTAVDVLGTHFNINAYTDEATINTTLVEGAVKVSAHNRQLVLKPGQQAQVGQREVQIADQVDLASITAWKEGYFSFNNADLPTVMRELARWYNLEVTYEGKIPERVFNGEIGRSLTLSQVLKGLSRTRIKYRIEDGHRIIIQP